MTLILPSSSSVSAGLAGAPLFIATLCLVAIMGSAVLVAHGASLESGDLVVVDGDAVFVVDPVSGDRRVLSGGRLAPGALAVASDGAVLFLGAGGLHRVDPATGHPTLVSGPTRGVGPAFGQPEAVAVASNGLIYLVDSVLGVLFEINPISGNRRVVTNEEGGPPLETPIALAILSSGRIFVADRGLQAILEIDPVSADWRLVADSFGGLEPSLYGVCDLASNGSVLYAARCLFFGPPLLPSDEAILRIDPDSGEYSVISGREVGEGPSVHGRLIAVGPEGDLYALQNPILRIDPASGARSEVASHDYFQLADLAVEATGDLLVSVLHDQSVVRIPVSGGEFTTLTNAIAGRGPVLDVPSALAVFSAESVFVWARDSLFSIDAVSGDRTLIRRWDRNSGEQVCEDVAWADLTDLAPLPGGKLLASLVFEGFVSTPQGWLAALDPATGSCEIVTGGEVGSGPPLSHPASIAVLSSRRAVVSDLHAARLLLVDLHTGERAELGTYSSNFGTIGTFDSHSVVLEGALWVARFDVDTGSSSDLWVAEGPIAPPPLTDFAVAMDGTVFGAVPEAVVRIDPDTGERTIASEAGVKGEGLPLGNTRLRLAVVPEAHGVGAGLVAVLALFLARRRPESV